MAVWIALAAVFIALIPVAINASRNRAEKKREGSVDGGGSTDSGSGSADRGSDAGGATDA